jgi:hypothetical protein
MRNVVQINFDSILVFIAVVVAFKDMVYIFKYDTYFKYYQDMDVYW